MKVLFIEDQPDAIEPIRKRITRMSATSEVCEFNEAKDTICTFRPDIVILDLASSESSMGDMSGCEILDFIWKDHFCPVIVYSAYSGRIQGNEYLSNPFVENIDKGGKTIDKLCSTIEMFRSHVEVIQEAEQELRKCFAGVMKDIAPYAFETFSDSGQRIEKIKRAGRRRIAALMDEPLGGDAKLAPWELYLFPPISNNIQMGDLLMEKGADCNKPNAFRVVLSPSCDLVSIGRKPKVKDVLVAKCCSMKVGLKSTTLWKTKLDEMEGDLPRALLNQGYQGSIIPFPALEKHIPTMAANLRNLDMISIGKIGDKDSDKEFHRVASIDSPFREMIAWAYMQIACRPGLPDRNTLKWAKEIVEDIGEEGETTS